MQINRRTFLGAAAAAGSLSLPMTANAKSLKILFLGGTGFLGPHTVQYAMDRGHEVTLFNRGQSNTDLFPELEKLVGNRDPDVDDGLSALKGRDFDAVIDTSGYVPRIVGASSQLMADQTEHYLFVSTICQYDGWLEGPQFRTEETPRATLEDPTTEDVGTHYCALKGYCERAAEEAMPGRVTQIRPGLIVGPRDRTDRFTYWPVRADRGGTMLAPGKPGDLTQYIDVRDLAAFMVHCLEAKLMDSYNVICPPLPMGDFLEACIAVTGKGTELEWVPADFLAENELQSWRQIQMWADGDSPQTGSLTWSADKSIEAGLRIRPVEETIQATLDWFRSLPDDRQASLRSGIPADKEADVLAAWAAAS
ncbi:MAG: NAD-dependent epimerase/dehydratase family protein [Pseudomonadota bacterium]